jgi:hypothetical protein
MSITGATCLPHETRDILGRGVNDYRQSVSGRGQSQAPMHAGRRCSRRIVGVFILFPKCRNG